MTFALDRLSVPRLVSTSAAAALVAATGLASYAFADTSLRRLAIAAVASLLLGLLALTEPRAGILALVAWMTCLGLVRRVIGGVVPGGFGDPLLLVGPVTLICLAVAAARAGAFRNRTRLAGAVLLFQALAALSVFNPLQGGLRVGFAGLLFVPIPMLAFWTGRVISDQTMRRALLLVAGLAVPSAIYGLVQSLLGFPTWDRAWINIGGYAALDVGGAIRAFANFSSAQEYAIFLAVGLAVFVSLLGPRLEVPIVVISIALLATAIILESSRGIVVTSVAAIGLQLAAKRQVRLPLALIVGVLAVTALPLVLSHVAPSSSSGNSATSALVAHQLNGLSNPFGSKSSTLSIHIQELLSGLYSGVVDPVGRGIGSITIAAAKFGGASSGTEVDPSNAAVALGLPGLLLYIVIGVTGMVAAYRVAAARRNWLGVATLGILTAVSLQWLNGGLYSVSFLVWLCFGWVDRQRMPTEQSS